MPEKKNQGWVYLICFSRKYRHAKHYLGWAKDPDKRFDEHKNGTGARLTQVVVENGIELVMVWKKIGTRNDERKLKNRKKARLMCPLCQGAVTNPTGVSPCVLPPSASA